MAEKTKVTRIKATDNTSSKASTRAKAAKPAEVISQKATKAPKKTNKPATPAKTSTASSIEPKKNVFARIGGYFKGAWTELKQVRWPTRKATWSLTLAVLLFSAFFVVLILLLDALFQFVFQTIIA